jgi:hypothetical protein
VVAGTQDVSGLWATGGPAALSAAARALAAHHFGRAAADAAVAAAFPPGAPAAFAPGARPGRPEVLIAYAYPTERRGPEVVAGFAIAYWDGDQVAPLVVANSAEESSPLERPSFHPVLEAHTAAVRALAGVVPQVQTGDGRVQARILDAPVAGAATISAINRWAGAVDTILQATVAGRPIAVRVRLPSGQGMLLPIGYPLGRDVIVDQAGVQLGGAHLDGGAVALDVWSPAGGSITMTLPSPALATTVDGRAAPALGAGPRTLSLDLPPGDHRVVSTWR